MKRFLVFFFVTVSIIQHTYATYDFSAVTPSGQTLYYKIDNTDTAVYVTYPSSSVNQFSYSGYAKPTGSLIIPGSVVNNGTTYMVTSIGSSAFYGCTELTSVTIGNSVTSIGSYAFYGCSGLPSVTIPNSVTSIGSFAFYDCSGLASVMIGNSVASIGGYAFYRCLGLTSITIPNTVTSIGSEAFSRCTGLTSVTFNADSCTWSGSSFQYRVFAYCSNINTFTFGNNVKTIPPYLCGGMTGLTSVTIPNTVTSIGDSAFYNCTGLTSATIPNSVTSIGGSAFRGCTGLTSVTIPNSMTSISEYVFCNCTGLMSITMGSSVTDIGGSAFSGCTSLTSVTIPNSVTSIGVYAFRDCTSLTSVSFNADSCTLTGSDYYNGAFGGCSNISTFYFGNTVKIIPSFLCAEMASLTSVTIGDSVSSIGISAFNGCTGLTSVTIPNSVTSIGSSAFKYCTGLTSVTIPNSVTSISDAAFSGCAGLTSVTIPNSVTSIGEVAFSGCTGLTSVTIPNSVTSIGNNAFKGCTGLTSVTIGNSVTSIGGSAFQGCDHITNISFGNGLQSIGVNTFSGCTQVVRIKSFATTAPTIQSNTFSDLSDNVIVNVPCGYGSAYENAAYWHRFDIQEDLMYNFSATSRDPSRGTVQIINTPTCDNAEAEIQANPYHGYHFARWSDGNAEAHRYLVVLQDTAIEAIFLAEGETEGIDDVNTDGFSVWSTNGRIHVSMNGEPIKEFRVYDLMGREVFHANNADDTPSLTGGVYLVKVGTLPAKKVVVIR